MAEVNTLSKFQHPRLVQLLGASLGPPRCLVYQNMGGGSLADRLSVDRRSPKTSKYPPMTLKERILVAIHVAEGLAYLHVAVKQVCVLRGSSVFIGFCASLGVLMCVSQRVKWRGVYLFCIFLYCLSRSRFTGISNRTIFCWMNHATRALAILGSPASYRRSPAQRGLGFFTGPLMCWEPTGT